MANLASIRKAAILVAQLDTRSADGLLELMGPQLAAHVRQAVMELSDVAPEEEDQVLADFLRHDAACATEEDGVEIELSGSESALEPPASPPTLFTEPPTACEPPLHFLSEVDPALVADVLAREQPQTVAVVVAHLRPEHAGQVLQRLPTSLATEALSRMAWLAEPAPGVLEDLARELKRRLAPEAETAGSQAGVASVQAILASLPDGRRAQLIERLARQDQRLTSRLKASLVRAADDDARARQVISLRYRLESPAASPPAAEPARQTQSPPLVEFEDLALLSQRDLGRLAVAANVQLLSLALIEADERLTRRLLGALPAAQAADIRQLLAHPGPIRLKDIDQAQRQLAELARRLARAGQIALPTSRHFAAAA
jgi:flagellar motor switch protein FliG